jgi:hypothetical protein
MKCPYQTKVIHRTEYTEGYVTHFAQDITEFGKCLKSECPFYDTDKFPATGQIKEHCRRAESEAKECGK